MARRHASRNIWPRFDPERAQAPILVAEHLGTTVATPEGPLTVLDDISFSIGAGDAVAAVGVCASGKSSLLALLAGRTCPRAAGCCSPARPATASTRTAGLREASVGFVFQSFQLLPSLSAPENVMPPLKLLGREDAAGARWAAEAAAGASLSLRLLARAVFDLDYTATHWVWPVGLLCSTLAVGRSGLAGLRGVLNMPPAAVFGRRS